MANATIPALVNPPLLVWAREESGYTPEQVAHKVRVKPGRLLDWEAGVRLPTVRQARMLAKVYRRLLGVFYLPHPPKLEPLAAEYRRLAGVRPGAEPPEVRFALREMSQRRETAIELREELGDEPDPFLVKARLAEGAESVAERLRRALGIPIEVQTAEWKDGWKAWSAWREAVEALDVAVYQFSGVDLEIIRGLSLVRFPLPVIGINSKEPAPESRAFTLMHELVHVALAAGSDEFAAIKEKRNRSEWQSVERFAEETAATILMPKDVVFDAFSRLGLPKGGWDIAAVRKLARLFKVTPLAMATRLWKLNVLTGSEYRSWKAAWESHVGSLKPRSGGFALPADKALSRAGRPFVRLVLQAMDTNRITAVQASHHLHLRFDHFNKLRIGLLAGSSGMATRPEA